MTKQELLQRIKGNWFNSDEDLVDYIFECLPALNETRSLINLQEQTMTTEKIKEYILANWFDGDENFDAFAGGDEEYTTMAAVVKALEKLSDYENGHMPIYIILKGSYSDRHICAVSIDANQAEDLKRFFSDEYGDASIDIYRTNEYNDALNPWYKPFYCSQCGDTTSVSEVSHEDYFDIEFWEQNVRKSRDGTMHVYIYALDKEHAEKIFHDKIAEYKANECGI